MANVPHSTLTGADLHIIKGADVAAAGQVPIANGSGDAPFGKLTHTSLQTTGNPFGAQLLHARDEQNAGTGPQWTLSTSTGWKTRVVNATPTNEISGASISSNLITLPAGTYFVQATLANPSYQENAQNPVFAIQSRLYNTTDSAVALAGLAGTKQGTEATSGDPGYMGINGRFSITGSKTFRFETYYAIVNSASFNTVQNTGSPQVYLDALIWKLA